MEDRFAARAAQLMMRSVELDFELNLVVAIRLDDRYGVFLIGKRDETLDMNSRRYDAKPAQRFERAVHERLGPAYVAVRTGPRPRKVGEPRDRRQAMKRVEQVNHLAPRRMILCQRDQLIAEDHRILVAF